MMDSIFATPLNEKTDREILLEVNEKLDRIEARQKRRGVALWIAAVAVILVIALLLVFFVPKYQAFKAQYDAVAETVEQLRTVLEGIDLSGLTSAAEFLSSMDYSKLQELAGLLDTLDTGRLSEQLAEMTEMIDQLGELNTEALVSSINTIIEKLQPLMSWLGR